MQKSDLLGKWYLSTDDGFKEEEVIDVSADLQSVYFKSNRKALAVSALTSNYSRSGDIASDPYAADNKELDSLMQNAVNDPYIQIEETVAVEQKSVVNPIVFEKAAEQQSKPTKALSIEEQAINSAILASKNPDKISVSISIEIPLALRNLETISTALGIDKRTAIEVLISNVKISEEDIRKLITDELAPIKHKPATDDLIVEG